MVPRQIFLLLTLLALALGAAPGAAFVPAFEGSAFQLETGAARDAVAPDEDLDGPDALPARAPDLASSAPPAAVAITVSAGVRSHVPGAYRARAPPLA